MNFIKADGVPLILTIFAAIMGVGGTVIGIGALIDPTTAIDFVDGADKLGTSWAGRNTGLGFAALLAVVLRRAGAYAVAFGAAVWRELSDVIAGLSDGGSMTASLAVFALIGVLELVAMVICARAAMAQNANPATS